MPQTGDNGLGKWKRLQHWHYRHQWKTHCIPVSRFQESGIQSTTNMHGYVWARRQPIHCQCMGVNLVMDGVQCWNQTHDLGQMAQPLSGRFVFSAPDIKADPSLYFQPLTRVITVLCWENLIRHREKRTMCQHWTIRVGRVSSGNKSYPIKREIILHQTAHHIWARWRFGSASWSRRFRVQCGMGPMQLPCFNENLELK